MKQEVRIKLDMSLTIDAKHSADEIAAIIERGIRSSFPNNHKHFNSLKFAEEAELYRPTRYPRWRHIIKPAAALITPERSPTNP